MRLLFPHCTGEQVRSGYNVVNSPSDTSYAP